MNIAFISFEYPPDTAFGGIGTYIDQITRVLSNMGHTVHVFSASPTRDVDESINNLHIHRIRTTDPTKFKFLVKEKFARVHQQEKIDVFESPEYKADGLIIKKSFPNIPLIVRLHTPSFLLRKINLSQTPFKKRIKKGLVNTLSNFRSGNFTIKNLPDEEEEICRLAEVIHSPSESLAEICINHWNLEKEKVHVIPNVFEISKYFLEIPIKTEVSQKIFYFGRLEVRKGIYVFEKLISFILNKFPNAEFHFIGKSLPCFTGETFEDYLKRKCKKYEQNLHFRQVIYSEIPKEMSKADICLFPSIWENFPNVCLEAMAAGKAIIASNMGGMKDMLAEDNAGLLINPLDYKEIASKIITLFNHPFLIKEYGEKARHTVIKKYNKDIVGKKVEKEFMRISKTNSKSYDKI